jgi:Tfp pilus assembly protein PilO
MTNTNLQLNGLNESVNNWKKDKKIWIIYIVIMAIVVIAFILLVLFTPPKATAEESKSKTIWELTTQMDELRNLKAECADNLWIADSAKFLKWMTWYCDSWDEEIISLRNQISELSKKSYEGLM